jgi:hypothetical protein
MEATPMTYTELNNMSAGWGFTLGSIAGDMKNNAKWCLTKKEFKTAQVSERELNQIMFWAAKEGIELKVSIDIASYFKQCGGVYEF